MANFEEQIKLLVELQLLDTHIFRLRRELEAMPEEVRMLEEEFKEKTNNLKKIEDGLKALQLKRKEKEIDLEGKEGSIKKLQVQLYQVKTNKEYSALEGEIARIEADNSLIEEEIIRILDQIDAENQKIAKEKEFLKSEESRLNAEKAKKAEQAKVAEAELKQREEERKLLAAKVDSKILPKYERIVNSKDGLAVVPVANEACQGCFRILPPQVINEIKMKTELVLCDNCARILYIEE
jgi:predicted  nucleic acid-binding Zn-ribbon protein